ncbi:ABC-2 type transport system ATP-binding protein [Granulicella aggregans]|uniref:ABC-2 type transport system ATP-binding protein n=2 Tax=Granulicella aggregans TaxID=474949 RepID=A0A7W8E7I1_9BACT|nr:ABC-2 type transport system ATP-binding protein [Granulicella aggregans]
MNLQKATAGTAQLLGTPSEQVRGSFLKQVGYISENQEMPESMTVVRYFSYLKSFYPAWDSDLERQLLREFSLPGDRKLRHLSRGMRMKVAFVGALSYRPPLLILDEPFSGLDPLVRDELVQGLLDRIGESTIYLSSHDLAEVETFATHVGHLESGNLVFSDEIDTLHGRFRGVEFHTSTDRPLPVGLPKTWLEVERSGIIVRYKHSAFKDAEDSMAEIHRLFPDASSSTFSPLSLRTIFLAHARTAREVRNEQNTGETQ